MKNFKNSLGTKTVFLFLVFVVPTLACSLIQTQISSKLPAQKTATKTELQTGLLPPTRAASTTLPISCQVTVETLHLRIQPSSDASVSGYLHQGDTLTLLPAPSAGSWLAVATAIGQTGYVNSKFTNCERK